METSGERHCREAYPREVIFAPNSKVKNAKDAPRSKCHGRHFDRGTIMQPEFRAAKLKACEKHPCFSQATRKG
jgi:hypothetical protein